LNKPIVRFFQRYMGYFFIAPAIIVLLLLVLLPVLQNIYMSFFTGTLSNLTKNFVGLDNYFALLKDERSVNAILRSLVFATAVVAGIFVVGMILALGLNADIRYRKFFRTAALLPWVVSGVVAGLTWRWLMNTQFGLVNDILMRLHLIKREVEWLSIPHLAFVSVIIATIWRSFPFVMLMLLAGLQSIDLAQYESASMDGANIFQRFWHITLPNLRPVSMPIFLTQVIWQLHNYDLVAAMTGLGPVNSTETLPLNIYTNAFGYFKFNYASAVGVVLLVFTLALSAVYVRYYLRSLEES
jgi:multiple sugar transport system permease protein